MAKWDIDRELARLEPDRCPGTTIQRATLDVKLLTNPAYKSRYGNIEPTMDELDRGWVRTWCLAIGFEGSPKAFFYARSIRSAYLQARKAAKTDKLAEATPWGRQDFSPPSREVRPRAGSKGNKKAKRRGQQVSPA